MAGFDVFSIFIFSTDAFVYTFNNFSPTIDDIIAGGGRRVDVTMPDHETETTADIF